MHPRHAENDEIDYMMRIRFNRNAAAFGALTAFLAFQAYAFAYSKVCSEHFNLSGMFGWLFITNFFTWIVWIPLALICAALWGSDRGQRYSQYQ